MKKYIKDNKTILKYINRKDIKIKEIRPVKKIIKQGILKHSFISSYCIIYDKMI